MLPSVLTGRQCVRVFIIMSLRASHENKTRYKGAYSWNLPYTAMARAAHYTGVEWGAAKIADLYDQKYRNSNKSMTGTKRIYESVTAGVPYNMKAARIAEGAQDELTTFTNNIHVNPAGGRNGCNLALAHGKNWTERWKDNRPLLNRIFMPSLYFNEGLGLSPLATGAGVQGVQTHGLYYAATLYKYLTCAQALAGDAVLPKPFLNEVPSVDTSSLIQSGATNYEDDFNSIIIPLAENRHTFMNDTNIHSELLIYEYICKKPCSSSTQSPQQLWQDSYRTINEGASAAVIAAVTANTLTADAVANVDQTVIGERPHGRGLHNYWKQMSFTRLNIPPGKTIQWVTHACKQKLCYNDLQLWVEAGSGAAMDCIPGWTKALMFILRGQIVAVNGASIQTYSNAHIRWEFETQTALWQPYRYQQKKVIGHLASQSGGPGIWAQPVVGNQLLYNNLTDGSVGYSVIP